MNSDFPAMRTLSAGDRYALDLPLRWGDFDSLNHLNNTVYFRLMEEARVQILYAVGLKIPDDCGVVLAHGSCDYLRPLNYPATVRVTHEVTRIGRSSIEFELILEKTGDASGSYARGRNVVVWMDSVHNRAEPWPDDVLARMGALFTPAG